MTFIACKEKWFVPSVGGNEAAQTGEQIRVKIRKATKAEIDELVTMIGETDLENAGKNTGKFRWHSQTNTKRLIENHVVEIENLSVEYLGTGTVAVKTGKEILAISGSMEINSLIDQICNEVVRGEITPEKEKN
jgi:hypothetical protein